MKGTTKKLDDIRHKYLCRHYMTLYYIHCTCPKMYHVQGTSRIQTQLGHSSAVPRKMQDVQSSLATMI